MTSTTRKTDENKVKAQAPGKRTANRRPDAKQVRSRRTRDDLMLAGLRLVETRDFDQISIADLVAEAGSSIGSFYHHFADKDDYLNTILDLVVEGLWVEIDRAFDDAAVAAFSTPALLRRAVGFIRDVTRNRQGLVRATLKKSMSNPVAWIPVRAFARSYEDRIGALLAARSGDISHEAGWERGFRQGMQMVYGTLFAAIVNRPGPMYLEDDAMVDELTNMLVRYLGVRKDG